MSISRLLSLCCLVVASTAQAQSFQLHTFERQPLTDQYYSEGANAADINGDGVMDVVYGPYWFEGPSFTTKREIYKPVPQNVNGYADNFFNWMYDFNGDGRNDVFVVGFPGTPAYVYENPGSEGFDQHWPKHQVFDWVSNESPQLIDIVGDELPELVCTRDGFFGFATIDPQSPFEAWKFHPISDRIAASRFGHGLGIGDINNDGREDIIFAQGWFEQPEKDALKSLWIPHAVPLTRGYGGAEMYAYDVDGDGDNDIITSERAHEFGLSWYEQIPGEKEPQFKAHTIMNEHPSENKYGLVFSELHSVALVDMDGDGLKDIVTGKTYWSHHKKSPMWDAGAVVYWFKLVRGKDGVDWVPHKADGEAGIGRQISIVDINNDQLPDIVVGGMLGSHVLTHQVKEVSKAEYEAAQPKVYTGPKLPSVEGAEVVRGPKAKLNGAGKAEGAIEGESFTAKPTGGSARPQNMSGFGGDKWSGDSQLFWTGAKPGDTLSLDLPKFSGKVDIEVVLTTAGDYGVVQLSLDDQPLGPPIDLYTSDVKTTGVLTFPGITADGTEHQLHVQVLGSNPKAKKAYMFAIDFLRIKSADGSSISGAK
ncbi:FG-GAP repeat domain-containing protein [Blastopirellula marina]|uniref:VCBS repeat-containing protein n=1 Tax=Blastopirellula marina TaxID=124 RepID=A0A2S8GRQ5_9BACT|nr:VCBS repeat-containing protein [Blastopirellula marina]PQO47117.1 VCBS repeat-containing protein [Blastopirellula marina]